MCSGIDGQSRPTRAAHAIDSPRIHRCYFKDRQNTKSETVAALRALNDQWPVTTIATTIDGMTVKVVGKMVQRLYASSYEV